MDRLQEEKNRLEVENIKIKSKSKSKIGPEVAMKFLGTLIDLNDVQKLKEKC